MATQSVDTFLFASTALSQANDATKADYKTEGEKPKVEYFKRPIRNSQRQPRNAKCLCGSGKKAKRCCGNSVLKSDLG